MNPSDPTGFRTALESPMSPLAFALTGALVLALLVLFRSRHTAVGAVIAAVAYLPQTETLNLGFHFHAVRLVLLAALIRVLLRGENKGFRWGRLDRVLLAYALVVLIMASLRAPEEFTFRLGGLYDVLLGYFCFRCLLRDEDDFRRSLMRSALVLVPFAGLMLFESVTNHNPFSVFNGVEVASEVRYSHVRAVGPFRNPITAGAFGATFAIFYTSLLFARIRTRLVYVGLISSLAVVYASHASGPFCGLALGMVAFFAWKVRTKLKRILWGCVGLLFVLQLFMKKPVWFLIGRVSDIAGGGGYHRALLIDKFVHYFNRWWMAGTVDTSDWFPYTLAEYGKADITNFFVAAGVDAGLLGFFLAIILVTACFKTLASSYAARTDLSSQRLIWGVGATMAGTIGILFSVTYMDQMEVVWYFLLASIAALRVQPQTIAAPPPSAPLRPPARKLEHVEWREKLNSGNVAV